MKRFFKILSLNLLILSVSLFSFIGYADFEFLNEYTVVENSNYKNNSAVFFFNVKNKKAESFEADVNVFGLFPVKRAKVNVQKREYVIAGGEVFGVKLYTKGVLIVGSDDIETENGKVNPAINAGLKKGDIIIEINGQKVSRNNDIALSAQNSNGEEIELLIERAGEQKEITLKPEKDILDDTYKAGLWVRDSSAGIGTVTYYDKDNMIFAGLGHPVCDVDTGKRLEISGGDAVSAQIKGCYKGKKGDAGELCGVFTGKDLGELTKNTQRGIFGKLKEIPSKREYPVALFDEIKIGKAKIISTVDGEEPKFYDVEITKLYKNEENRNMVVKITDKRLIQKTGGIVQGMSGSPIIQDDKIIGALTHVFLNDPTQGYGIFIGNMMAEE